MVALFGGGVEHDLRGVLHICIQRGYDDKNPTKKAQLPRRILAPESDAVFWRFFDNFVVSLTLSNGIIYSIFLEKILSVSSDSLNQRKLANTSL